MNWRRTIGLGLLMVGCGAMGIAQPPAGPPVAAKPRAEVMLWANGAPHTEGKTAPEVLTPVNADGERIVTSVNQPSITPFPVRGAKGPVAAVIVMPGGGHYQLSIDHEGYDVARFLNGHGVAAFVLKYRLAHEKGSTYTVDGDEMDDVQRAIRLVKSRAAEWGVDPERVGVMGFFAGGELAVKAAERFGVQGDGAAAGGDDIDKQNDKVAFVGLMYPGGLSPEIIAKVTKDVPPAFMMCGADDRENIAQQLPLLFVAWRKAGVSAELHEYAGVGHGFGLRLSQRGAVADWAQLFVEWMDTKGFLQGK